MKEFLCIAIIIAVSGYILNTLGFMGTRLFFAFGSVVLSLFLVGRAGELLSPLLPLLDAGGTELAASAMKVVGISYIGGFFSDFCTELSARGAAEGIVLLTRIEIAAVAMPYFTKILSLAGELLL